MKSLSVCLLGLLVLAGCSSNPATSQADAGTLPAATQQAQTNAAKSNTSPQVAVGNAAPAEHSLYFNFDQSTIKDEYKPVLQANADYLNQHAGTKVVLQGNTDERGSSEYNLALGNRRAQSAKKVLTILGVANKDIEVVSFGKEKPKADCHEESCWSQNRRADIVYSVN